ncbi:hypothetical protein K449DRAFT_52826 [Hypoxylon sp. EC38]|nr:hypothetical protein K449DRAFT_52826 [Hypoxylon sp. EC38]
MYRFFPYNVARHSTIIVIVVTLCLVLFNPVPEECYSIRVETRPIRRRGRSYGMQETFLDTYIAKYTQQTTPVAWRRITSLTC